MPKYLKPKSIVVINPFIAREKKIKSSRGGRFKVTGGNEHSHSILFNYPKVETNQEQQIKYNEYTKKRFEGEEVKPPKAKYGIRTHNKNYTLRMEERRKALKHSNALCSKANKVLKEVIAQRRMTPEKKQELIQALNEVRTNAEAFNKEEEFFLRKNRNRSDYKLALGRVGFISKNQQKLKSLLFTMKERDHIINQQTFEELVTLLPNPKW